MRSGGAGASEENASVEAAIPEESVIVISDDEGDVSLGLGNSVLLIEDVGEGSILEEKKTLEVLDEEIAITFSKQAYVLPHARYDCSSHPFIRTEQETQIPLEDNANFCAECYCYLCDKRASECEYWTTFSSCHCNAHNKSKYWKSQRDTALAGALTLFNLDLTEIDSELREAGNRLQSFTLELSAAYYKFLEGTSMGRDRIYPCGCACHKAKRPYNCNSCINHHTTVLVHDYHQVHQMVSEYLTQAEKESPKAVAVMLLGVARELVSHKALPNMFPLKNPTSNLKEATLLLMTRIVTTLQRLLVLTDYPQTLYEKFVAFYNSLPFPPHCYTLVSGLSVLRWDSWLLTSVLAGQNLTGVRTNKGKKEFLWEVLSVVQARVKRLEEEKSYRQLVRYLNAVQSHVNGLNCLKQKLCFYMCKYGDFPSAAAALLQTKGMQWGISKLLTPAHFECYLIMLRTRSCPLGNELTGQELCSPPEALPLKKGLLVRTAIRVLYSNNKLLHEPKCWSTLIRTWCTSETLTSDGKLSPLCINEPEKRLQLMVMDMSCTILDELHRHVNVHLPDPFHNPSTVNAAELILVVQAIVRFVMASLPPLHGMLELVLAFGFNHWALSLLLDGIGFVQELLLSFVQNLNQELSEREVHVVDVFTARGPHFVSLLISSLLFNDCGAVRAVGFHMINILLRNKLPWTDIVGNNLKKSVVDGKACFSSTVEHQNYVTLVGRLTARS